MFRNAYIKNVYLLSLLISVSTSACGSIKHLWSKRTIRAELKDWTIVTDQEKLDHLSCSQKSVFALAEDDFVVIYPKNKSITPYVDDEPLPPNDYLAFWLEEVDVGKKLFFEAAPILGSPKVIPIKSKETQVALDEPITTETLKQDPNDLEMAIEIEGEANAQEEVLEIAIEELKSGGPKVRPVKTTFKAAHKYIAYAGSSNGLYAKSYIFTDRWTLTNPEQNWVKISDLAVSHLLPRRRGGAWWGGKQGFGIVKLAEMSPVLGQERVKFLSEGYKGLYLVSFSDELFVYSEPQNTIEHQKPSQDKPETTHQDSDRPVKSDQGRSRQKQPAVQPIKQPQAKDEQVKSEQPAIQPIRQSQAKDEQVKSELKDQQESKSKEVKYEPSIYLKMVLAQKRINEACQGPVLAMHAQVNHDQVLFFCGSDQDALIIKNGQDWHRFSQTVNMPQRSKLMSFQKGWLYRSRGLWHYLSSSSLESVNALELSGKLSTKLENQGRTQQTKTHTQIILSENSQKKLWLTTLKLTDQVQDQDKSSPKQNFGMRNPYRVSTWTIDKSSQESPMDTLLVAKPYQGLDQLSHLLTQRQTVKLKTSTLSAKVIQKAFITNSEGDLITTNRHGTLIGTKNHWKSIKPQLNVGQIMGLAQCKDLLWITNRKEKVSTESTEQLRTKRLLELWPIDAKKALLSLDWSSQDFRQGEPSIGEVKCDAEGNIFANLFWGKHALRVGVGLLIIEPKLKKMIIWERRQGYDGEEELSKTPLLPSSIFNAMSFAQDQSLYIATNSGLMKVDHRAKTKAEQLQVFDEASGLSVESFGDLHHEIEMSGTEHLWLASPYGLLRMLNGELRIKLKGVVTALTYDVQRKNLWVSFKKQLWVGQGQGQDRNWRRVYLPPNLKLGQINHIFPTSQGALWLISDEGVFFNGKIIEQL